MIKQYHFSIVLMTNILNSKWQLSYHSVVIMFSKLQRLVKSHIANSLHPLRNEVTLLEA